MSYLLRLVVADRPGMLGAIATAIGLTGADIVSLNVVERAGGYAVDDLVIDMPVGGQPDALLTAARSVPDVEVESVRPFSGSLDMHRELALIEALAAAPDSASQLVAAEVPRIFRSGWAVVVSARGVGAAPVVEAASPAAPDLAGVPLPWLPLSRSLIFESSQSWVPESWARLGTALMAAPLGGPGAVLVGRPGGPDFRPSELLRLTHLAGIAVTVSGAAAPAAAARPRH